MSIIDDLKRDEGVVPWAYDDATGAAVVKGSTVKGYVTCGVGFLIDKAKGGRIPDPVIDFWLEYEVQQRRTALASEYPWFNGLNQVRQDVIVNMAFNLGLAGFAEFKQLHAALAEYNYPAAATQILNSHAARTLPIRYGRLAAHMSTGA